MNLMTVRLLLTFAVEKAEWFLLFKKCNLLNFKRNLQAFIKGKLVDFQPIQRDSGLVAARNLNWVDNFHQQNKKDTSALCQIKRKVAKSCMLKRRLNAFNGNVYSTLMYGSQACSPKEPSRKNLNLCKEVPRCS